VSSSKPRSDQRKISDALNLSVTEGYGKVSICFFKETKNKEKVGRLVFAFWTAWGHSATWTAFRCFCGYYVVYA
jgi:hypothetical protein